MVAIENFIYELDSDNQRAIMQHLHELFCSFPELTGKIRYRVPFYYRKSWLCYMNPQKGDAVELAFIRGNELLNPHGHLDFKKRTQVCGITYNHVNEIDENIFFEILQDVFLVDDTPYASKRTKK